MMKSIIKLKHHNEIILPQKYIADDVRSSDNLVEYFINEFTKPDDIVFDPFSGFGTTLVMVEKLGRIGYGLEYLPDRTEYIKSLIKNPDNIICGSALEMDNYDLPQFDFSFTSPPYMTKNNHAEYPFAAYQITGDGYEQYLHDMKTVYRQLSKHLKSGVYAVVKVCNIIKEGVLTTLAWDVAKSISEVMTFEREIIIEWEGNKKTATTVMVMTIITVLFSERELKHEQFNLLHTR